MEKSSIVFEKNSDYLFHIKDNTYGVKILAKKDDIKSIELFVNDKYLNKGGKLSTESECFPLTRKYKTPNQDIFIGEFTFTGVVMALFFKITDNEDKVIYYGSYRFYEEYINEIGKIFDVVPYLLRQNTASIPSWANGALMYQIFAERYAPTDEPSSNWNDVLTGGIVSTNGTLVGIKNKLEYIKSIGVDVVYLTPIFKAQTNHRYDTEDYYLIDPKLGTNDDLVALVDKTHSLGMHFVMDLVFNHTSCSFFAFQDILKNQEKSKYKDWYVIDSFPISLEGPLTYKCFARVNMMPKLNTANEEVQDYLLKVVENYCKNYHLDGIRMDVADEIDLSFLRRMRKLVKSISKDIMIYGELWFDAASYLHGDIFDSVMNYQFFNYVYEFLDGKLDSKSFGEYIDYMYSRYHFNIQDALLNILSSHDTERIPSRLKNDKSLIKIAFTLLFLLKGSTMLYYGEENGLYSQGYHDNRGGMKFEKDEFISPIINKLSLLKKKDVFRLGEYKIIDSNNDKVFIFSRYDENSEYKVVINMSNEDYKLDKEYLDEISSKVINSVLSNDVCVYKVK